MATLRDRARELASFAEGEIEKREVIVVALRRKIRRLREELAEAKNQNLNIRPPQCEHCAYRVIAIKVLEAEKAEKDSTGVTKTTR